MLIIQFLAYLGGLNQMTLSMKSFVFIKLFATGSSWALKVPHYGSSVFLCPISFALSPSVASYLLSVWTRDFCICIRHPLSRADISVWVGEQGHDVFLQQIVKALLRTPLHIYPHNLQLCCQGNCYCEVARQRIHVERSSRGSVSTKVIWGHLVWSIHAKKTKLKCKNTDTYFFFLNLSSKKWTHGGKHS